jgi:hypothetical protein
MNYSDITKDNPVFKGFYKGKIHISKIYNTKEGYSFEASDIFLSFHDLATGEIMQTKTLKGYMLSTQTSLQKVDIHFIFQAHGYFIIEFHGLDADDQVGFVSSF